MNDVRPGAPARRRRWHAALALSLATLCTAATVGCSEPPVAITARTTHPTPVATLPPAGSAPAATPPTPSSASPAVASPGLSTSAGATTGPGSIPPSAAVPPVGTQAAPGATPKQGPTLTPRATPTPDAAVLAAAVAARRTANAASQLPGGGRTIFAGGTRMYVALYGHPSSGALGLLGEQGTAATIRRAKSYAARYEPYTTKKVVPALEIIATIAAAAPGPDKDYSAETPVSALRPLVKAAKASGQYVVLDLQPGRSDLLTQAKRYASLLAEPHVGLALDPEWRLTAHQKPLRQIGSVSAAEINSVSQWLAALTKAERLPQKMLLLHQFRLSMIRNRSTLNTSHPELAVVIQMDGQGSQPAKQGTWRALRVGAPKNVQFGWKNFIDEDSPMLTPKKTMTKVKPTPVWVSYQ